MGEMNIQTAQVTMTFMDALQAVIDGKRVTKLEWHDDNAYCELRNGHLQLHKSDGRWYDWIINDGDLAGTDWIVY